MKICLVAHNAYGAISGNLTGHIGGVEHQTHLMGRWLAARGHDVSLLTWDEGQEEVTVHGGIRVIRMCRRSDGIPGLRFLHPRWTSLVRAMAQADAEIYYHNTAEYVTGQVALWCRRHRRRFVFSAASDADCDVELPWLRTVRERVLYRYGLRRADGVIVQTNRQQKMLSQGFRVTSTVLPMPCDGPADLEYLQPPPLARNPRVVWVGRIHPVKRLDVLLDAAAELEGVQFLVAGGSDADEGYVAPLLRRAREASNVEILGKLTREQMATVYRKGSVLCCTSITEGFPNTFLEAWSHGLPVVSTFDPDGLIRERGLGIVADDFRGVARAIRALLQDNELWSVMSQQARRYYREHHAREPAMLRFEVLFRQLHSSRGAMT